MIRWRFTQVATESQETYRVDINDPTWSGSVTDVKGVGFSFQHQSVSDTDPFSTNILEGQLSVTLYVSTSDSDMMTNSFLETLVQGEDDDYSLILSIKNGIIYDTLWTGSVLPDLTIFDESFEPYKATIVAKDFALTKIQNYTPDNTRRSLIEIIKEIVQEEVNITVKSFTAFKSKDVNDDYLSYVYIDDSSLKQYPGGAINKYEALQWILQSNNLILWQWNNNWFVSQLSAYGSSTGYVYDSSTDATTLQTTRLPLTDVTISSKNTVVPSVGLALGEYKHRTRISLLDDSLPSLVQVPSSYSTGVTYDGKFDADADSHTVELSFDVLVNPGTSVSSMNVAIEIGYGDYRWLIDSNNVVSPPAQEEWVDIADITGGAGNRRNILELSQTGQFGQFWVGSFSISTDDLPQGDNETFFITFYRATDNLSNNHTANYNNVEFVINDVNADNNSESIGFLASTNKAYSYQYKMADVYFGDAVVEYQRSKYLEDDGAGGLQNTNSWQYRGETRDKSFIELLSEDVLNFMNKAKRLLNATVKIPSTTTPLNVNTALAYDGIIWVYLGGSLDSTGNWNLKLIEAGKVDNGNTVDLTPVYGDRDFQLLRRTSGLLADGTIKKTTEIESGGSSGTLSSQVQYLNADGKLTELITAGTADFIQAVASRPEFSSKQNNVPSKSQVFLFSYDGTGGLTDNRISGFSGGSAGKLIRVINVGSNSIVLSANDTDSSVGNRILGSNVTLQQYEAATLIYIEDFTGTSPTTTIDGWIIVGKNN